METTDNVSFNKFDIGRVLALKAIRDKSHELLKVSRELGEPLLDDFSLLPKIYEAYLNVFKRRGCPNAASQVFNRKNSLWSRFTFTHRRHWRATGCVSVLGINSRNFSDSAQAPPYPTTASEYFSTMRNTAIFAGMWI